VRSIKSLSIGARGQVRTLILFQIYYSHLEVQQELLNAQLRTARYAQVRTYTYVYVRSLLVRA